MRSVLLISLALSATAVAADLPPDHAARMARGLDLFRNEVRPILKEHCVKCHGGEKVKADFDLATREGLLKGGKEGEAIKPFNAGDSWMMKLIRHEDDPAMPDNKPKLPAEKIAKISEWIDLGAPYDEPLVAGKTPPRDRSVVTAEDRKWWAFQPLAKVTPPADAANPVDAFLLKAAAAKQLTLNPPADRAKLLRRVTLGLTGIPPTPEETAAFSGDTSADAWQKVVARLLASPAFGERWARHWLDVARFAESSGFEHDYDRPNAFHYRDFVIKALNADMPYDQFVRWQIAGDEFAPGNPLALMATGFLGAGVFPTQITANEVERTRYDALDDMLSTTGSAFLGLTIGCARCHDHKFDPIPTRDYYRLLSTFTTTVRSNIDLEVDPEKNKPLHDEWAKKRDALASELAAVEKKLAPAFDEWTAKGSGDAAQESWTLLEPSELKSNAKAKFKALGDGSYLVEGENGTWDTYTFTTPLQQGRVTALRVETLTHPSMKRNGPGRAGNGNFGLGKIEVTLTPPKGVKGEAVDVKIARAFADFEQNHGNLSVAGSLDMDSSSGWAVDGQIGKDHAAVFVFDQPLETQPGEQLVVKLNFTVNTQHNIGRPRLSITSADDPQLEGGALSAPVFAAMQRARSGEKLADTERATLFDWWKQRDKSWQAANGKLADHASKEPSSVTQVLVCAEGYKPLVMHSQGAPFFEQTHILKRGDVNQKVEVAQQGFLQVLTRDGDEKRWLWQPPQGAQYSGRRRALANWLTDVEHGAGALLARVAVNRLWQHHFGRGLVPTANDFGKTGAQPSNPELLDWLAGELIRNGWRLKPIHELLLTSAAYQQSAKADAARLAADPDNALFLRRTPQRLEAEAARDSILAVTGLLDPRMFGPGTLDEASLRRSIYFTVKRSRLLNSMVVFDAPEPLVSQGSRPTTTVAPQALLLMNSPQVRGCAMKFADRIDTKSGDDFAPVVTRAYEVALSRAPRPAELQAATKFIASGMRSYAEAGKGNARTLALADFCQTVLALNEFIYVD